jgi:hypothetical protein
VGERGSDVFFQFFSVFFSFFQYFSVPRASVRDRDLGSENLEMKGRKYPNWKLYVLDAFDSMPVLLTRVVQKPANVADGLADIWSSAHYHVHE